MIEEWRAKHDNCYIVGDILMDLSKVFDCIPQELLIATLHAYGLNADALAIVYSYLKGRKQSVKINNTCSSL